jgi:hypothetical protein
MIQFDMSDVMWMDEETLARRIRESFDRLRVFAFAQKSLAVAVRIVSK